MYKAYTYYVDLAAALVPVDVPGQRGVHLCVQATCILHNV